jgi:hypothetical protein
VSQAGWSLGVVDIVGGVTLCEAVLCREDV